MSKLLTAIARKNFLVVGRAGMDFSPHPPGTKIEDGAVFHASLGGSAANIAAGLVKQGCKAALVTSVSDDAVGRYCLNQLDRYGVDRTHVISVGGEARNSLAVTESVLDGHETVIYRNGAADFEMTKKDVDALELSKFDVLITAGTVFAAEPSRGAAFHALEKARATGLPVIFDIDYRPYSWPSPKVASDVLTKAAALSDMIVGNDDEFGFMAGDKAKGRTLAEELSKGPAEIVIYKMGEKGAVTFSERNTIWTGIYKVDAVKPTGAGDSFMAGLLAALADGRSLRDAIMRGSASAAIVVSKPGCAPAMPTQDELDLFISGSSRPN